MREPFMSDEHSSVRKHIVDSFHKLYYYDINPWFQNIFLGYPIFQCPFDLQIYQELICYYCPHFIVQTGIAYGGSLFYFASMLDLMGAPLTVLVIGIDVKVDDAAKTINHPRIRLIEGDSTDQSTIDQVKTLLPPEPQAGMVVLDSNHRSDHVYKEILLYREFVGLNSYLVVEDTNLGNNPVEWDEGPGPLEAVTKFLQEDDRFISDDEIWKRHLFSFHQGGWLKRIK